MSSLAISDDLAAYVAYVRTQNPHSIAVFTSRNEQEFIDAVEGALLHSIMALETGCREFATLPEIALTKMLSRDLNAASIPSTAEEHTNGHVDFTIKHPGGRPHRYLGECKIWKGPSYHVKGMKQLLSKYSTGRHRRGCCLEFVRGKDLAGKFSSLREYLDRKRPLQQLGDAVTHETIKSGFVTSHRHESGWDLEVLHFGCNLHSSGKPPIAIQAQSDE